MATRVKPWRYLLLCVFALTARSDEAPTMELLEFLATWQDDNGAVLDPAMFDDTVSHETENDVSNANGAGVEQ